MINQETIDEFVGTAKSKPAVDLLKKELPKMQPSALKHAYLASVANVRNHPVAEEKNEADGSRRLIGFADLGRRLPLTLIINKDGTVRHAFAPNVRTDRELLKKLQADENRWAKEHRTKPRNIASKINGYKQRHKTNFKGLTPPHAEDEAGTAHRSQPNPEKPWYKTKPLPINLDMASPTWRKIGVNIARSVNMNLQKDDPRVEHVKVVARRTKNGYALAVEPPLVLAADDRPRKPSRKASTGSSARDHPAHNNLFQSQ